MISVALAAPWPFAGRVVQRFELSPDSLALTMEVHAQRAPMPAACGWHPWWSRELGSGDPLEVELHADGMYVKDDEGIPTGELTQIPSPPWDDCFTDLGEPAAVLHWPGAATVTVETDCPCVVIFTEPEHAECVEPQSGPPDALNIAPHVVEPGAPLVAHTTWRWSLT
jgi:galactose mutarotase-like enzyme